MFSRIRNLIIEGIEMVKTIVKNLFNKFANKTPAKETEASTDSIVLGLPTPAMVAATRNEIVKINNAKADAACVEANAFDNDAIQSLFSDIYANEESYSDILDGYVSHMELREILASYEGVREVHPVLREYILGDSTTVLYKKVCRFIIGMQRKTYVVLRGEFRAMRAENAADTKLHLEKCDEVIALLEETLEQQDEETDLLEGLLFTESVLAMPPEVGTAWDDHNDAPLSTTVH